MATSSKLPPIVGRYPIVRELGKGAMGRVLLAHDPVLDRAVAIKHLRHDLPITPEQREQLLERMRQEARASARVSHANLVALHDMGEEPNLGLYLVFEYVEGPTLKQRLEQGPLATEGVATIARHVGTGLRWLHAAGVIHRDVKPENVILSRTGAKLTDFGIARVPDSTLTGAGNILGTPAYSAPETIRASGFSPQSDQFSLAATLYEALSGRRAFPGDDAVFVATLIANEEPQPIAMRCGLPLAVDAVLMRALSKRPEARFEDCETFGRALAEALAPEARLTLPTLPDAVHSLPSFQSGRRSRTSLLLALLLGACGTWFGTRWLNSDADSLSALVDELEPEELSRPVTPAPEDSMPAVAWLKDSPKNLPRREPSGHDDEYDETAPSEGRAAKGDPARPGAQPKADATAATPLEPRRTGTTAPVLEP